MNSFALHKQQPWPHNLPLVSPLSPITPCSCNFSYTPSKSFKSIHFSTSDPREFDEEVPLGDCIVFEEGAFDDSFLSSSGDFEYGNAELSKNTNKKKKSIELEPENLIPEDWIEIQRELNLTKNERRKLSQQLDYGKKVEKRRLGLMPINSEVYEQLKKEKLKQLRPVVLDNPELKHLQYDNNVRNDRRGNEEVVEGRVTPKNSRLAMYGRGLDDKDDNNVSNDRKGNEVVVQGRVTPKNPRLAVYGRGLDDISELFNSGSYNPAAANNPGGSRKLFSKEEKTLLNRRVPDLAVATSGKWNPLHTLAASGEFYLVNSLLKNAIDINVPDKDGLTAIHRAILSKKQAIFNFLVRESINTFVRDKVGATLLHYAVFAASSQMIKILLLYNVDINLQDCDGWTPLHLAVHSRRTDIVKLLLIKGADKTLTNKDGLTPLDLCLYSGRDTRTYELIKLMKLYP